MVCCVPQASQHRPEDRPQTSMAASIYTNDSCLMTKDLLSSLTDLPGELGRPEFLREGRPTVLQEARQCWPLLGETRRPQTLQPAWHAAEHVKKY